MRRHKFCRVTINVIQRQTVKVEIQLVETLSACSEQNRKRAANEFLQFMFFLRHSWCL